MYVIVNSTSQFARVANRSKEIGEYVYTLRGLEGREIWNGSFRRFNESQLTVLENEAFTFSAIIDAGAIVNKFNIALPNLEEKAILQASKIAAMLVYKEIKTDYEARKASCVIDIIEALLQLEIAKDFAILTK